MGPDATTCADIGNAFLAIADHLARRTPWGKLLADEADARSIERGPDGFARRTP